ncbi:translation initiation factor IF-2 [Mycoplasmopsis gallinarum]|uniref:Translation initiation factor IF-2 n=1 Tax=Mycoplasmopsis gallinarum TaxID=29557 RepID=A0A168RK00_9BACT|nr:translation initiation factor IF-2 [Mycoplasmopsis gallinarum]OAB49055.1 Translation initiation factor 2 [Mycoplasmopsis gallinarum]
MDKNKRIKNEETVKSQLIDVKTEVKDGVFIFTNKMPIAEFAQKIGINPNDIIKKFLMQGKPYTLNRVLEEEEIAELCLDYNLDFKKEESVNVGNFLNKVKFDDNEKDLRKKPPVVTVMGHVDHGKTTLIDYIRKTKVAQSESSGITQHTGAYQVNHKGNKITFIDTPGHEVFTEMRQRGAKITDVIILVVAADDGVMPQTKEAIQHAKEANVPLIVFVNKMDKPTKNVEKIKYELLENEVVLEEYNGDVPVAYGSAKTGQGIDELLEAIILMTDLLDLKANPMRYPSGTVIESKVDKGIGTVATVIIENGTMFKGDFIVAGSSYGRVKSMIDATGARLESAGPSTPVIISGLNTVPLAGDRFIGFEDEKFAKKLAQEKSQIDKNQELFLKSSNVATNDDKKIINIIIRSDVHGTAEALKTSIDGMSNDDAKIRVILANAGQVSNSDLLLAQTSNAIIVNFNIKPNANIRQSAKTQGIKMIYDNVVFNIVEEMKKLLDAEKTIVYEERKIGTAHVIKVFTYSKVGTIAGALVDEGVVRAGAKVKVFRKGKMIHKGVIETLKRELNDAKEVEKGKDFGTHIKDFNDIKEDDVFEFLEDFPVNK